MAQHDYDIANQSGANFRADLNNALDAIVSNNSGSSEPSTKFAYEWWIDTSNNLLKLRNSANNAWITLPLSITADNSTSGALTVNGNLSTTGTLDVNGGEVILDADADTSITADTDDQIDFKIGNVDVATLTNSHLVLKGTTPKITIGDGGAEDTALIFDGNAQDYYLGLDDTDDVLKIGTGSTLGTTRAISITSTGSVGFGADTGDVTNDGTAAKTFVSIIGTANRGQLNLGSTSSAGADGGKIQFVNGANSLCQISGDANSGSTTAGSLDFFSSTGHVMRITNDSKIGIGTTAPDKNLHVVIAGDAAKFDRTGSVGGVMQFAQGGTTKGNVAVSSGGFGLGGGFRDPDLFITTAGVVSTTGNLTVGGALSKASGSFKINHPLESMQETHNLYHSFVEAPQADNIYRGIANLENGTASINLDEVSNMTEGTFEELNRDIQCFTTNETDWDAVKGNVVGNILNIQCQNTTSSATISWLVVGERQDKEIYNSDLTNEDGKLIVEKLKSDEVEHGN